VVAYLTTIALDGLVAPTPVPETRPRDEAPIPA
jgi:hypothetical protein